MPFPNSYFASMLLIVFTYCYSPSSFSSTTFHNSLAPHKQMKVLVCNAPLSLLASTCLPFPIALPQMGQHSNWWLHLSLLFLQCTLETGSQSLQ